MGVNQFRDNNDTQIEGATDGTKIGNIADALKVTSDPDSAAGTPVLTKKVRTDMVVSDVVLSGTYSTVYSYTGSGKLVGISLDFETVNASVKVTIDSTNVIFDGVLADLKTMTGSKELAIAGFFTDVGGKKFLVDFRYPILYTSEVKIEAKDPGSKKLFGYLVVLSKET